MLLTAISLSLMTFKSIVVDRGKAAGAGDQIGTVLYNRGMYNAMLITEAARTAQAIAGKSNISQADMIKGFEALEMTEEKMAELLGFQALVQALA